MEKYRSATLNTAYPMTNNNHRFLNTTTSGPLYTMGGSTNFQQQYHGPQLLMNTNSVGTSTQFQFVPARHHHHSTNATANNNFTGSFQFDFSNSIAPIFNGVKAFFTNLLKPTRQEQSETMMRAMMNDTTSSTEKRKSNSAPNIYTGIMPPEDGGKCVGDFDKGCFVDVADYEMLAKLSSSTKSFSDYNLPSSGLKSCSTYSSPSSTVPERTKVADVASFEEKTLLPQSTKETNTEKSSSVPVPALQSKTTSNISISMPNVPTKPRKSSCTNGNRVVKQKSSNKKSKKKSGGGGKNKKEKDRHALALKIHEDCETEIETMSADEWDEPLVIITAESTTIEPSPETLKSKVVSFSTDDFPAMPQCTKQIWELPRLSHCLAALNGKRKQRQLSECDSEDSFIVFDNNDKLTPSSVESNQSICDRIRSRLSMGGGGSSGRQRQLSESSDDDFICFEMEESDVDSDCDDDDDDGANCDQETSDSECESEVDVKSSGTNPPDSGFEDKKVRFNLKPVVHVLRTWTFAHQQARKGEWEQNGRDRVRFHDRIKRLESTINPILAPDHRQRIYCDRFLNNNAVNEPQCVQ